MRGFAAGKFIFLARIHIIILSHKITQKAE